jgi:hypothetical protein
MADEAKLAAPYVPFATFETGLDKLAHLGGIPPKIDHSVFLSMGGLQKGQVISAFKFLGLIDSNGIPDPLLSKLALNKDTRKEILRTILEERYPNISVSDLATMSPGQLDTKLSDKTYNVSGATRQKARTFLLKAAEYAGIPLSKLLTTKGPRGGRNGPKKTSDKGKGSTAATPKPKEQSGNSGTEKTVELKNGGTVTLSLDVNILELKGNDRKFVFELIDKLDVYEHALPLE